MTLHDRSADTLTKEVVTLREAFAQARAERPFHIEAIVILPDHLHAIFQLPNDDCDFAGRWRRIKGLFTHALLKQGTALAGRDHNGYVLWQRRYWEHMIRDETDFSRHLDYIHFNPVKHGFVSAVREWPFSSFHRFVRSGLLPVDWGGDLRDDTGVYGERN